MKMTNVKTETYKWLENIMVDIVTDLDKGYYNAWIYEADTGYKEFMFGVPIKQDSYEGFLECVDASVYEHYKFYQEDMQKLNDILEAEIFGTDDIENDEYE